MGERGESIGAGEPAGTGRSLSAVRRRVKDVGAGPREVLFTGYVAYVTRSTTG